MSDLAKKLEKLKTHKVFEFGCCAESIKTKDLAQIPCEAFIAFYHQAYKNDILEARVKAYGKCGVVN